MLGARLPRCPALSACPVLPGPGSAALGAAKTQDPTGTRKPIRLRGSVVFRSRLPAIYYGEACQPLPRIRSSGPKVRGNS